ncbi:MAG: thioredoxin domain-containing protein [Dehalococcoidia bacterium]
MAIVGLLAVLVVAIVVVVSNTGGGSDSSSIIADSGITHNSPQEGAVIGQPGAPLTMIEYFRFDCPHCADYALQTAPQIEKDYVDTGKLRIEERAMALSGDIVTASGAALCAGDQNHYFDYYDLVFANQTLGFSADNLKQYARKLNLDTGAFDTCLNSKKYEQGVVDDTNKDVQAGINSTPTFFIGGNKAIGAASVPYTGFTQVSGAQAYDAFKKAIDAELAKAQ